MYLFLSILLSLLLLLITTATIFLLYHYTLSIVRAFTKDHAPFVPSPKKIMPYVLRELSLTEESVLYDLGCGDARILKAAYVREPRARYVGLERDFLPYIIARWNTRKIRKGTLGVATSNTESWRTTLETGEQLPESPSACEGSPGVKEPVSGSQPISSGADFQILRKNFFKQNLSEATHIVTYLFPELMDKLLPKLKQELSPGTVLVSVSFPFKDKKPERVVILDRAGKLGQRLYIYKF